MLGKKSPREVFSEINDDSRDICRKAYFVHIPKTAGNTVRTALTPFISNNARLDKSQKEHKFASRSASRVVGSHRSFKTPYFDSFLDDDLYGKSRLSFSVIRNPFDLLLSYHMHYVNKNWIDDGWANVNGYHNITSFEQFIDLYTSIDPEEWHVPSMCRNLYGQIFCDEGTISIDYILYKEDLLQGMADLVIELVVGGTVEDLSRDRLAKTLANNTGQINVSPKRGAIASRINYMDYYSDFMIKKVKKKCEWELDNFYFDKKYNFISTAGILPK